MNEMLHWAELIISGGMLVTIGKILILVGKMIQTQENHTTALIELNKRVARIEGVFISAGARHDG